MNRLVKTAKAANKAEALDSVTGNTVAPVEASIQQTAPPLTPAERKLLAKCEKTISKGLKAFKPVYLALQEICEQHLYRAEFDTFQEYCRAKWNITARHANRLMLAGAVVANIESDQLVSSVPAATPDNEGQARPLAPLPPAQQVAAARIVAQKPGKHTAKDFKDAADKVSSKPKVTKAIVDVEEDEEKPRVQIHPPPINDKSGTNHDDLAMLLELVDAAQTQARKTSNCADVVKTLSDLAKAITRKLNGGAK